MLRRFHFLPALGMAAVCCLSGSEALGEEVPATGAGRPAAAQAASAGSDLELARRLGNAFATVAETASPSVVVVRVRPKPGNDEDFDHSGILEFLPEGMRKNFKERMEQERKAPRRKLPEGYFPEQGSGVVIREDGYVLTNGHVVENAEKIEVRLKDGRRFPAEVRGVDQEADVAVLKISATGLPTARMGDSAKVRVGEFAVAIGAPFELEYSVTFGHISAKGRRIVADSAMMDQDFLQTDASINPGNSGGPLVNLDGEVIGINTMIRGLNTGIGFAVPVNLAKEVADQLIEKGRFSRAWLGVGIDNVGDRNGEAGSVLGQGVLITQVLREGPSWGSELKSMDVVVAVDGEPVRDVGELKRQVSRKRVGKPLALEVLREDKKLTIEVTPGELPAERFAMGRMPRRQPPVPGGGEGGGGGATEPGDTPEDTTPTAGGVGLKVRALDSETASRVGLDENQGVVVMSVEAGSPAAKREIQAGDVITKINRRPVKNPKEFAAALEEVDLKKGVPVTVYGGDGERRYPVLKK
jgi:serine protease Do